MDMYDRYINAAKEAFNKKMPIIVDRFHVAKLYRKSLVSLRKKELARLKKVLSEEEYRSLKAAIALLCHHKEFMTAEEKKIIESLFKHTPILKTAYTFCCQLTAIYNSDIDTTTASLCISFHAKYKRAKQFYIMLLKKYLIIVIILKNLLLFELLDSCQNSHILQKIMIKL